MNRTSELVSVLKRLRLSGLLQSLDIRVQQAANDNLAPVEFLHRLLCDEVERRDAHQADVRLKRANFDQMKTFEDFEFSFNPQLPKAKIVDVATCVFVQRRENVCIVGQTGVGKSHVAQAIGQRACLSGYSVVYTPAHDMFVRLRAARADESYDRHLKRYVSCDLLVVDDLGLMPLRFDEPTDLYEIIRQRYERGAMIITSHRAMEEWAPLFSDRLLASAAMDRLLHHVHLLVLEGQSYRNPLSQTPGAAQACSAQQ